jgi:radical SAM-linked protein
VSAPVYTILAENRFGSGSAADEPMVQHRVRIRFSKQGDLRLISHRDLLRTFERLFRRAGIEVCLSEGFHPKPRMNFASPLALGTSGLDEVLEVDLAQPFEPLELLEVLNRHSVPGLNFHAAQPLDHTRKAQAALLCYRVALSPEEVDRVASAAGDLMASTTCVVIREPEARAVDIRPLVADLSVQDSSLLMTLLVSDQMGVRPRDVLEKLGLSDLESAGFVTRTAVELK